MDENKLRVLRLLMERMKKDPGFMAYALDVYCRQQKLDEIGLVTRLVTTSDTIVRLALCKRPDSNSPKFTEQVQQIANYTSISQPLIFDVLKASEALIPEEVVVDGNLPSASSYAVLLGLYKRARRRAALLTFRPALVIFTSMMLFILGYWVFTLFFSSTKTEEPIAIKRNEEESPQPGNQGTPDTTSPGASQSNVPGSQTNQRSDNKSGGQSKRNDQKKTNSASGLNPKDHKSDVHQIPEVRLKLSEIAALRDANETRPENQSAIRLRQQVTELHIELLPGSRARVYNVGIIGPFGESLLSTRSRSLDGKFLQIRLDLRALEPGRYRLCLSQSGDVPDCYSLQIEP